MRQGNGERLDRRDSTRSTLAGPRDELAADRRALAKRCDRVRDDRARPLGGPPEIALACNFAGGAAEPIGVEVGTRGDVAQGRVVRVHADAPVAEPDDERLASVPADALGVAERAVRHEEMHARVRVLGEVHADRQAFARVEIVARSISRTRDEPEANGERGAVGSEELGVVGEEREEDRIGNAGAIRITDAGAREDRFAGVSRDVLDVVLGRIGHRVARVGHRLDGRRRRRSTARDEKHEEERAQHYTSSIRTMRS
jgi:hypothetical protein